MGINMEAQGLTRRSFLSSAALATVGGRLAPRGLLAQGESPVTVIRRAAATAKISIQNLRGNVFVLEGSGGSIAVLPGRNGKLLMDAGITASRPAITEALASISPDPVGYLINTHWHFDHTDGNDWLHSHRR